MYLQAQLAAEDAHDRLRAAAQQEQQRLLQQRSVLCSRAEGLLAALRRALDLALRSATALAQATDQVVGGNREVRPNSRELLV